MTFLVVVGLILSMVLPIALAVNGELPVFWSFVMVVIGVFLLLAAWAAVSCISDAVRKMEKIRKIESGQKVADKNLKDIISNLIISNGTIDLGDTIAFCKSHSKIKPYTEYIEECLGSDVREKLGELVASGKVKKHFIGNGQYIYINNSGTGATMQTKTIELNVD